MQTAAPYSRKSETLQRQPSTTDRYAAMSPPVSPCQWRYRGSGSSEPKGLTVSRKAAFPRTCQSSDVDSFRTPPPAAPPLSALYARQRRTLLRISHTQTSQRVCQLRSSLNPKLSTIKIRYSSKRLTARRSSVSRSNKPAMRSSGSMFAPSDLATAGF